MWHRIGVWNWKSCRLMSFISSKFPKAQGRLTDVCSLLCPLSKQCLSKSCLICPLVIKWVFYVCRESEKTKLLISQQTQKVVEKEAETERIKALIGKKEKVTLQGQLYETNYILKCNKS